MLPSQKRETASWIFGVAITIAAIIGITFLLPAAPARGTSRDANKELNRGTHNPRQPASAVSDSPTPTTTTGAGETVEQTN